MASHQSNTRSILWLTAPLFAAILTVVAAIGLWPTTARAQNLTVPQIIAVVKTAGTCATHTSAANFAERTNMPGGREFVQRFWADEAARAGETPQGLLSGCRDALRVYSQVRNEVRGNRDAENVIGDARLTGVCVVLRTMAFFASKAKIPGSPAFVNEFWANEIASTGRTSHDQFVRDCDRAAANTADRYNGGR